jgi:hypothetical protein
LRSWRSERLPWIAELESWAAAPYSEAVELSGFPGIRGWRAGRLPRIAELKNYDNENDNDDVNDTNTDITSSNMIRFLTSNTF